MYDSIVNEDYFKFLRDHPLVNHLQGKLWHATSLDNYLSIREEGTVRPNDGSMIGVYERRAPNLTACEKIDAISLFDFGRSHEQIFPLLTATETIGEYFLEWGKFLCWYSPITIILVPKSDAVADNIETFEDCEDVPGQWIYNVEVCHEGSIELSDIQEVILVRSDQDGKGEFKIYDTPIVGGDAIQEAKADWFS